MSNRFVSRLAVMCAAALMFSGCVDVGDGPKITQFKSESKSDRKKTAARVKTELAIQYVASKSYRQAVVAIEEAVKDDPSYDVAWLARAQVYQHLNLLDKADESFRHALAMNPASPENNNNYGWFLCSARNQPAASISYFDRALADPTYPTPEIANMNKGICSAKAGQSSMADAYFERALQINPTFAPVHKERARVFLSTNKLSAADKEFRMYQSQINQLSADDLLLGWRIAKANGQMQAASEYEAQLRENFPYSDELKTVTGGRSE
nr:type IV pilus biogenesis/stability protein PilW [uncultured Kingella sp.]